MSITHQLSVIVLLAATPALAGPAKPAALPPGPPCTAKVVVGNPRYSGSDAPKPDGQPVIAAPPVQLRGLAVQNGALHGHTLYELWTIPAAAAPDRIVRYAGIDVKSDGGTYRFQDGPCASARFPQISGIAAGPDGSIIVTDRLANAVVRVDAPGQTGCTAKIIAGPAASAKIATNGLAAGDSDGEGGAARFSSPTHPAVDEAGNIYLIDNQHKVRRVAADAAHTVTTVATLPSDSAYNYTAMAYLKGKLYTTYLQSGQNTVFEIDPSRGTTRAVLQGNGAAYPPLDRSVVPGLGAITSDGAQLYITGRSLVWSLTTDGKLAHIAGSGTYEFSPRDDIQAERPARALPLPGSANNVDMAFAPGTGLLFRGRAGYANNSYVVRVSCSP